MIDKDALLKAMLHECDVALHLHGKLDPASAEYRPTPGQRSMIELLRYLSFCGVGGARYCLDGDGSGYKVVAARAEEVGFDDFPAAMQRQKNELRALFETISPEDFATRPAKDPVGNPYPLGVAMMMVPFRWLVGYRMQLFLYAKSSGVADIGTRNCWAGVDAPKA